MTNPLIHILVLAAAIVIPGGLIVYLGWAASKKRKQTLSQRHDPTPDEAVAAFLKMYPKTSLRAQNRAKQLMRARTARNKKSQ